MILQVRRYQVVLRAANFVLPFISFVLAAYISVHWFRVKPGFTSAEYLYLALFTTLVWSIVAEWQEVTSMAKISAENTGLRASFSACTMTYVVNFVALFFVHQLFYSRIFVIASAFILLVLTVSVRTLFRLLLREFAGHQPEIRVVILGAGRFAARTAVRVQRNEFVPCRGVGYIQCAGEEVRVSGAPVFQLSDLEVIEKLGADNILIAVPPDQYGELQRYIAKLQVLCKPIRVIVNAGFGMRYRSAWFKLAAFNCSTSIQARHRRSDIF
jgi:FlaA1/EpsC-like NDP-sugar epimerase